MKAKVISGQAPGGARTPLAEVLPLRTPFVVQVFPIYACNFRCNYCIFSVDKSQRGFISDRIRMDVVLFQKCVDEMTRFEDQVKVLRFVGIGEPLLHKDLAQMVACAARKGVARTIELITNGSLLTPERSESLIEAGLDRLVVSIQGTSEDKYRRISRVDLKLEELLSNLRYFFEHKKKAHVYIKAVDASLDGPEDEKRFFDLFGDICDTIAVEHIVPIHGQVDYEGLLGERKPSLTQFGLPVSDVTVCPQPFFSMQINPDGKVVPCYSWDYPEILGDCDEESLPAIWNGRRFHRFRRAMLDGKAMASPVCERCTMIDYRLFPEDDLSPDTDRLKALYDDLMGP